jgi:hypothetical protein
LASISPPTSGRPLSQPADWPAALLDIGLGEIDQLVGPIGQRAGEKTGGQQHDQDQPQRHQRSTQVIAPADPGQQLFGVETPGADPEDEREQHRADKRQQHGDAADDQQHHQRNLRQPLGIVFLIIRLWTAA